MYKYPQHCLLHRRPVRLLVEVVQRDQSTVAHALIQEAVEKLIRKNKYFRATYPLTGQINSRGEKLLHLLSAMLQIRISFS